MSVRSFEHEDLATVAIERAVLTKEAGTYESDLTFASVAGMSALPAAVQHMSSAQVMRTLGKVKTQAHMMDVDNDHMPTGGVINVGDHVIVASGIYQGTYEVQDSRLVQGREWNCTMVLKPESKTS